MEYSKHTLDAIGYAEQVKNGQIGACEYVKTTCSNFINNLREQEKEAYLYYYCDKSAAKVCSFIELLPHTKGEWAFKKERIKLEPWQKFILVNVFGWLRKKDNLRRYRRVYSEIPRKNGKSVISSGVGLYMLCLDKECGAEVYSGATTEKQAKEIFTPARLMAKKTPQLLKAFNIKVNAESLVKTADNSKFEPIIGKPGDGASPSCALIDEYHEHNDDSLYTTMRTGQGARRNPLLWVITTAGFNINSPCYYMRQEVINNLNGTVKDDELFGMIYTVDLNDDWTTVEVLKKANPNFGVSIFEDFLVSTQKNAISNPQSTNAFKTKHLNIWATAKANYFNTAKWYECEDKTLKFEDFIGDDLAVGVDLARKIDMNAAVFVFKREIEGKTHYYSVAPKFYVPEDTIYSFNTKIKKTADMYKKWAIGGELTSTEGAEVDYRDILRDILRVNEQNPINVIAIDPSGATALSHEMLDLGLNPVVITQNFTQLSDPMKELEAAINSGRFHHDGNPILTWCVLNVIGKHIAGNDDVVRPVKAVNENKIDGAVALIMAISRLMINEPKSLLASLDVNNLWEY